MSTLHFNALVPPFDLGEGTATEALEKANILTYGADSTGVVAADTAFKEALENSEIVYFPKGTYLFNENHTIKGHVVIYGDGQNLTKLKTNQTPTCAILSFQNPGVLVHDLKLEGPLSGPTGGALMSLTEEVYGEGSAFGTTVEQFSTFERITTIGGFNHIELIKCGGVSIKEWVATEVRGFGLNIVGERPGKQVNLVYVLDCIISGKKGGNGGPTETIPGSIAIRAIAAEALTFAHVDTEFCEVGMELNSGTENSWFTDCFFDTPIGTGVIVSESKGCNFDKLWSNSIGYGGGLILAPTEASLLENCNFTNCWFFNNSAELVASSGIWKEISETEYNALASKKGVWVEKKAYAAKDGVTRKMEAEQFPITGGGIRYYEAQKATKVQNPRIHGQPKGALPFYTYQVETVSYALKDAVEEEAKFYENIKAQTIAEATAARKPKGAEGATFWKEVTEAEWLEFDHPPVSPANGITIGPTSKECTISSSGVRLSQNNGIHIERAASESEQNISLIGNQLNEYKGFGTRIGANQGSPIILGNAYISLGGRGAISSDTTKGFTVFNTGATEFLTAPMSKPAEQVALVEGVLRNEAVGSNLRTQILPYKTKAEAESKVKHKLNSTAIYAVMAYKYVTSKFGTKMELATKTVESYTVNTAGELTIKWSSALVAKEEIAIVVMAY